jgi:hypothetical protein
MTISVRVEKALSAQANGFRYVHSGNVAVVSTIGTRDALNVSLRAVMQACVEHLDALLAGWLRVLSRHRLLVFAATTCSDQHNALSRRRGVWGSEDLSWLPQGAPRSLSVELSGELGTRFAGLAEIKLTDLFEAADFARTNSGGFLFVSSAGDLTEERVRTISAKVFPKGDLALDWAGVIDGVEDGEEIRVRASGGFDDREASLDAFLSTELLSKLGDL